MLLPHTKPLNSTINFSFWDLYKTDLPVLSLQGAIVLGTRNLSDDFDDSITAAKCQPPQIQASVRNTTPEYQRERFLRLGCGSQIEEEQRMLPYKDALCYPDRSGVLRTATGHQIVSTVNSDLAQVPL